MTVFHLAPPGADEDSHLPRIPGTSIFGNFDGIDQVSVEAYACGWAFDGGAANQVCEVEVFADDRIVGHGAADIPRPDVRSVGAPRDQVGFRVRLRPGRHDQQLRVYVASRGQSFLLKELRLPRPLPFVDLDRTDVISAFRLLFGRDPEDEGTINHQLSVHATRTSLLNALFQSPEFHEKNMDIIDIMKNTKNVS